MFRLWVRSGAGDQMYLSRVCCNVVSGAERPSWPSILVITPVFFIRPTLINIRAVTGLQLVPRQCGWNPGIYGQCRISLLCDSKKCLQIGCQRSNNLPSVTCDTHPQRIYQHGRSLFQEQLGIKHLSMINSKLKQTMDNPNWLTSLRSSLQISVLYYACTLHHTGTDRGVMMSGSNCAGVQMCCPWVLLSITRDSSTQTSATQGLHTAAQTIEGICHATLCISTTLNQARV